MSWLLGVFFFNVTAPTEIYTVLTHSFPGVQTSALPLLPLQEDRLGLRVSYARNELPGYTDNAVDGRDDINGGSQTGARAALVWDGDAFDLKLAALHQGIDSDNSALVSLDPATGDPMFDDLTGQAWQPQPFTKDLD